MEQDIPDYDMDSEDEKWLAAHSKIMNINPLKFEEMMDRLEKNSGHSVVTQKEAEVLLKDDSDLIIAVYDYWLNKRLKTEFPLPILKNPIPIPEKEYFCSAAAFIVLSSVPFPSEPFPRESNSEMIKVLTAKRVLFSSLDPGQCGLLFPTHVTVVTVTAGFREGSFAQTSLIPCIRTDPNRGNSNNPYLAFQRRTEKIQTRKNRKNDETTYEKMVKLKRDLSRALSLLEFVKRRESSKRELLNLTFNVFEKRFQAQDFNGQLLSEVSALKTSRPAFAPIFTNQYNGCTPWTKPIKQEDYMPRKEKRQYKKRKHKNMHSLLLHETLGVTSSGDDESRVMSPLSPKQEEPPFTFRRKRQCTYHAPVSSGLGNWPWCSQEEGGLADQRYRFNLTSIANPSRRCVGLARRRVGRGGRIILDRAGPPMDDFWASLDFTIHDNSKEKSSVKDEKLPVDGKLHKVVEKPLIDEKPPVNDRLLKEGTIESPDDKLSPKTVDPILEWTHFRPKSPILPEPEEKEQPFNVLSSSSLSLAIEDLSAPSSEFMPVQLNLSELFPTLVWDNVDSDLTKTEDEVPFTLTPPSEEEDDVVLEAKKEQKMKQVVIGKKEYQSGSLLDRWARFESPSTELTKKKMKSVEPLLFHDKSGCSAFRTSNLWPEAKVNNISEPTAAVTSVVKDKKELKLSIVEVKPYFPPTPPREVKKPSPPNATVHRFNNFCGLTNGPKNINSKLANNLLKKHIVPLTSYRKKNNNLLRHGINRNGIIMRLPKNPGEMLEKTVVGTKVDDALLRKSTQVAMEVT